MIRLLCISDFTGKYSYELIRGMMDRVKGGKQFSVFSMPPQIAYKMSIDELIGYAKDNKINVIVGQFDENPELKKFAENGVMAFSQDFHTTVSTLPRLTEDYDAVGACAADFLVEKGFKNYAFFGVADVCWSGNRYQGFVKRLRELGFDSEVSIYNQPEYASVWQYKASEVEEWLRSLPKPIGLFACNDAQALKVMQLCEVNGIEVPSEVSIIGADNNVSLCNIIYLSLTSVDLDVRRAGYELACQVEEMQKTGEYEVHDIVVNPIRVVPRLSVANIYSADKYVNRALSFIHTNVDRKLSVGDVLTQVPLSRRLLEEKFKKFTGESIYSYILSVRVERFSNLLIEEPKSVSAIVAEMGEEDPRSLSRRFKALKGCTPEEWREKFA